MQIVLPDALPPAPYARELALHLPARAPVLCGWMSAAAPARLDPFDSQAAGCTCFQAWQLRQAGFQPLPGQAIGAGLGPLLAGDRNSDDEPVWLADLVHLALGTDQAVLLPLDSSPPSAEQADALFAAAEPLFAQTGFAAQPLSPMRWRLHLPTSVAPLSASPDVVARHPLSAWWQLDASFRPWRRLLNEIQMAWHEHPVNLERAEQGLLPINGLWLYGGGRRFTPLPPDPSCIIVDDLRAAGQQGDWSAWLDALTLLDTRVLAPLEQQRRTEKQTLSVLLLGEERSATFTLSPRPNWLRWMPRRDTNWKAWWSPPV